jgi:hypothetical protein
MAAQSSIPCRPEVRDRVRELKGERTYDELLKQLATLAEEGDLDCRADVKTGELSHK